MVSSTVTTQKNGKKGFFQFLIIMAVLNIVLVLLVPMGMFLLIMLSVAALPLPYSEVILYGLPWLGIAIVSTKVSIHLASPISLQDKVIAVTINTILLLVITFLLAGYIENSFGPGNQW